MKKKLILCALATVLATSAFTACNNPFKSGSSADNSNSDSTMSYDAESAAAYVKSMYREKNKSGRADYDVIGSVEYDGAQYGITWSTNTSSVVIGKEDDHYVVDVDEAATENVSFVLTAMVTAPDGTFAKIDLNRTLEAAPSQVSMPIDAEPIVGTEYMLHVFHELNKTDLYPTGKTKSNYEYYFLTTSDTESAITIYAEAATDGCYIYHLTDTGAKEYINIVENGKYINSLYQSEAVTVYTYDTELNTIVTTVKDTKYFLGTQTGYTTIGAYSDTTGLYVAQLVTMTDRSTATDEDKLAQTERELSAPAVVVDEYTYALNQQGNTYPDAKITWAVNDGNAKLGGYNNRKMIFESTTAVAEVSVTATISVNGKTKTKDFTIKHIPDTPDEIMTAALALQPGESFANDVTLTGMVTAITQAYDADYANVTLTIKVGEKSISCRRLEGDGADVLAAGYTITVTGQITNYNGTIQLDQGCELVSYTEGTLPEPDTGNEAEMGAIVDEAYQLESGASMSEVKTLTGVVLTIDDAYDSGYKNVTVTIVVANKTDKPIKCYRMKGDEAANVKVGDTITVTGTLKNYYGTIEFDSGCTLNKLVAGNTTDGDNGDADNGGDNGTAGDDTSNFTVLAKFDFGEAKASVDACDGNHSTHIDGSKKEGEQYVTEETEYSVTVNNYTLTLTDLTKVFEGAYDCCGNSCLKLGTGTANGTFSFTVSEDVNHVVIYVANYKAKTSKISINGNEYELSTKSHDGEYTAIVIDTTTTKKITLVTGVSGDKRCMIDTIEFCA